MVVGNFYALPASTVVTGMRDFLGTQQWQIGVGTKKKPQRMARSFFFLPFFARANSGKVARRSLERDNDEAKALDRDRRCEINLKMMKTRAGVV